MIYFKNLTYEMLKEGNMINPEELEVIIPSKFNEVITEEEKKQLLEDELHNLRWFKLSKNNTLVKKNDEEIKEYISLRKRAGTKLIEYFYLLNKQEGEEARNEALKLQAGNENFAFPDVHVGDIVELGTVWSGDSSLDWVKREDAISDWAWMLPDNDTSWVSSWAWTLPDDSCIDIVFRLVNDIDGRPKMSYNIYDDDEGNIDFSSKVKVLKLNVL